MLRTGSFRLWDDSVAKVIHKVRPRAAAMTGSGSAVFGVFDSVMPARRAARALAGIGAMALITTTVDRRTCLRGLRMVAR